MKARHFLAALAAVVALAVLAIGALQRDEEAAPAPRTTPVVAATPEAPEQLPRSSEAASPAEALLLAQLEEARDGYASMRSAFESGGRQDSASEARLNGALRAIPDVQGWATACRGELCQVKAADASAGEWQRALGDAPSVRAVADRVVLAPDGRGEPAYVVLAPTKAARGHDLLSGIEAEFLRSSDARYCLSGAGATGSVEYELSVDSSGYSYRTSTDLPRDVADCVNGVLGDILRLAPVPPRGATLASRTFGLRR